MSLFGKKAKCYSCGGEYGLQKCGCGRHYCAAHGFGGKCFDCQTRSMGTVVPRLETFETQEESPRVTAEKEVKAKGELIPRMIRAIWHHTAPDLEVLRASIAADLERYRPVYVAIIGVESNREVRCFYRIQYVVSRITVDQGQLELLTDLERVPSKLPDQDRVMVLTSTRPLQDERFAHLLRFLHNEISYICELILRSSEANPAASSNDLPIDNFSPRLLGTCPWCGAISFGLERCRSCLKEIPLEMSFRSFMKIHAKRQYMGKLVALRSARMDEEIKQSLISQTKARLRALDQM